MNVRSRVKLALSVQCPLIFASSIYSLTSPIITFGGIPEANSSNTELLLSTKTSPPSRSSKTSTVDTVTSASLLRPYQKSDSVTPTLSAFSTRTNSNPNKLQSRGIPVTAFNPLLTQAMMAAQIGLLSTPNTLLSMMQAATAHNSLIHHNRCNDRNGQIVPAVLHQLSALHSSQSKIIFVAPKQRPPYAIHYFISVDKRLTMNGMDGWLLQPLLLMPCSLPALSHFISTFSSSSGDVFGDCREKRGMVSEGARVEEMRCKISSDLCSAASLCMSEQRWHIVSSCPNLLLGCNETKYRCCVVCLLETCTLRARAWGHRPQFQMIARTVRGRRTPCRMIFIHLRSKTAAELCQLFLELSYRLLYLYFLATVLFLAFTPLLYWHIRFVLAILNFDVSGPKFGIPEDTSVYRDVEQDIERFFEKCERKRDFGLIYYRFN
ncbi:Nuclear hormone receptor family member nhr-41 [Dirofilaria immitis]|nr:Nuclear hormone receptor family member nhr-41 [Dirofilaria immitis]